MAKKRNNSDDASSDLRSNKIVGTDPEPGVSDIIQLANLAGTIQSLYETFKHPEFMSREEKPNRPLSDDELHLIREELNDLTTSEVVELRPALAALSRFRSALIRLEHVQLRANHASAILPAQLVFRIHSIVAMIRTDSYDEPALASSLLMNDSKPIHDRRDAALSHLTQASRDIWQMFGKGLAATSFGISHLITKRMRVEGEIEEQKRPGSLRDHHRSDFSQPLRMSVPQATWKRIAAAYSSENPDDECDENQMKTSWYRAGSAGWYDRKP